MLSLFSLGLRNLWAKWVFFRTTPSMSDISKNSTVYRIRRLVAYMHGQKKFAVKKLTVPRQVQLISFERLIFMINDCNFVLLFQNSWKYIFFF